MGDAIDSFNMNATFFEAHGVKVLGAVFNNLPDDTSYYSLENCKEAVLAYFKQVWSSDSSDWNGGPAAVALCMLMRSPLKHCVM